MHQRRIRRAIADYWKVDHVAFLFELVGSLFTMVASAILAITSKEPEMLIVYILYLIGSSVMCYAYVRRNMVWSVVLTIWFTLINIAGLIVLLY